ncbi:MAG: 3-phosphoshikimate 1-carboxyvinyltransferase, partial [Gaiellaceae bacterium]
LAHGRSEIVGLTHAKHVSYTLSVLRGLGTQIRVEGNTFFVDGGPYHPRRPTLSVGSSGTTLYFMIGLCALADRPVTLIGQRYFQRRPVGPLLAALGALGIDITSRDGCPPIAIRNGTVRGGHVRIAGTLSQWISGLLMIAAFAERETTIEVDGPLNERPYVDLTISMMRQFGLVVEASEDRRTFVVPPQQEARPTKIVLPPDIGSAAFGLAIAALHPCDLTMRHLRLNGALADHPERAFLDVIREMGLPMEEDASIDAVRVRHDGLRPKAVHFDCRETPDILPILATLATFADGESVLENVDHVRLKESDRVSAMLQLNRMGGKLEIDGSRLVIRGVERLSGRDLSSFNDHRVLMSLAIAGTRANGYTLISYPNAYRISYPEFLNAMHGIGVKMECVT